MSAIEDQNGNPQVWNNYYPFGETMRSQVNSGPDDRYGFISKELDAETGLYHLGARSYDPWGGRFLETDPVADLYPSQSPYSYSFDCPERFLDPSGLGPQNGGFNWQFGMNGTIAFFNNSGTQFNLPLNDLYQHQGQFLDVNGAYLDLFGQMQYTGAKMMTLSWGSLAAAGAGFGGGGGMSGQAAGSGSGGSTESALSNWSIAVSAVATSFDSQYGILKYGNALDAAGAYGAAVDYLGKATGIASAYISLQQFRKQKTLGNFVKLGVDVGVAAWDLGWEADPAVLLGKGILDATGASDFLYKGLNQFGTYFTTYGYTYDPHGGK